MSNVPSSTVELSLIRPYNGVIIMTVDIALHFALHGLLGTNLDNAFQ